MEQHYQVLANALLAACAGDFEIAMITGTVSPAHAKLQYQCTQAGEVKSVAPELRTTADIADAARAIQTQMTPPGQQPWSRFVFTLKPDGTFRFDVEYDN